MLWLQCCWWSFTAKVVWIYLDWIGKTRAAFGWTWLDIGPFNSIRQIWCTGREQIWLSGCLGWFLVQSLGWLKDQSCCFGAGMHFKLQKSLEHFNTLGEVSFRVFAHDLQPASRRIRWRWNEQIDFNIPNFSIHSSRNWGVEIYIFQHISQPSEYRPLNLQMIFPAIPGKMWSC